MTRRSVWRIGLVVLLAVPVLGIRAEAEEPENAPYYLGVDLSYVNEMEDCGGEYRVNGEVTDPFRIFSDYGANLVRVRLWHTPTWTKYSTLEDVKKTIGRAKAQEMAVLLDFHYSDTWADPSKQIIPAAWADITDVDTLAQAMYDDTFDTLMNLDQAGLMPDMVQVGNEINTEILRGENESGYPIHWERNARLINAGIQAVRDAGKQASTNPQVMLHIAKPEEVEGWLLAATRAGVTDFDIVGISYYPGWSNFTINATGRLVNKLRYQFGKDVMIAETAYPWTLDSVNETAGNILDSDFLLPDYPATPVGQKQFLIDLTQTVLSNGGLGVVYWEPAWISTPCHTLWGQGSHWENATFFDFREQNNVHEGIEFLCYAYETPVQIRFDVKLDGTVPSDGLFFWGDFTGLGRRLLPMERMSSLEYSFSARLMPGETIQYALYSGPNRSEDQEILDQACAGEGGVRVWTVPASDTCVIHTFGQCGLVPIGSLSCAGR
jgi:arabinogalactan endo-1,4-beta-galactosidase